MSLAVLKPRAKALGSFALTIALTYLGLLAVTFFIGRVVPVDPALAIAARLLPGVLTTTRAIGECMLRLVRMDGVRPAIIDNAAIARNRD